MCFSAAGHGGFDYLNPNGTGHLLIPPANSSYIEIMREQQGLNAGGGGNSGQQLGGNNSNNGNQAGSSLAQAMSSSSQQAQQQQQQQDQRQVRFTASMMANAQSSDGGATTADGTALQQSNTVNPHQLNQELVRQQFLQQSNNINILQQSNSNPIGVTVMEPPSMSNSPAPQRSGANAAMIGVNGNGLLYPLAQQVIAGGTAQNQVRTVEGGNFILGGAAPNMVGGNIINFASGGPVVSSTGRASAPPPHSQPAVPGTYVPPGGMTTMVMNNAAIRAYTASSLQMRVAELHQELGAGNNSAGTTVRVAGPQGGSVQMAAAPPGTVMLRTLPTGAVPIVLTPGGPTPPPPGRANPVIIIPPGNNPADPLLSKQISRSNTPLSTLMITPNPTTNATTISSQPQQSQQMVPGPPTLGAVDSEQVKKERAAVQELTPFLREPNSSKQDLSTNTSNASTRGLAILYASTLHVPDVRSTCEAFGALESFRSDFGESKGVFFATFYDLRSAQLAVVELPKVLNKLSKTGGDADRVQVNYCVPLNSSSVTDESMLMLSNLPGTVDEQDLNHVLSSFGEVRAIQYQANMSSEEDDEGNELVSYMIEFYDVQDARQALLELEQTNPWGTKAKVKVGTRSPTKRKQGKELIILMSCWRQSVKGPASSGGDSKPSSQQSSLQSQQQQQSDSVGNTVSPTPSPSPTQPPGATYQQHVHQQETMSTQTARTSHVNPHDLQQQMELNQNNAIGSAPPGAAQAYYQQYQHPQATQAYQLVVGPDGQYSYALVNQSPAHHHHQQTMHQYGHMGQMVMDPHQQQQQGQHVMYAPVDLQYQMHNQHHLGHPAAQQYHVQYNGGAMPAGTNYGIQLGQLDSVPPTPFIRLPSNDVNASSLSSGSHGGSRMKASARTSQTGSGSNNSGSGAHTAVESDDNNNLALSIENVRHGRDHRSSLMVRNIPNKYTQQMLLSEFAAAGHGSTKMDFFYLPIDFKNKCNRGYAFVNFVDYRDIVPFFDEYNGTSWKRFNSDKICDITYARIQGKAAMLKRFENSALMEKDAEYRPKVFVSHGERKGELEVMPGIENTPVGSSLHRAVQYS